MALPVEVFLALHHLKPRGTFVTLITLISILGVLLGVCVLIITLSVMVGFRENLEQKIIGFNAEVNILGIIHDPDELLKKIMALPEVKAASPFVQGPVMVVHDNSVSPAYIKSVSEDGEDAVFPMKQFISAGQFELRGDSVIVGTVWAKENVALPGDKIQIYGPAQFAGLRKHKAGDPVTVALPDEPTIRGIFQTNESYDEEGILVSTALGQEIYGLGESVQGIAIRLKNPDDASEVRDKLNAMLPATLQALTWEDQHRELFSALAMERIVMSGILFLITVVAAFGVGNTLITITVQKSREIGLMKALGASDRQICLLFTCHGFIVGATGAIGGIGLALLGLYIRNDVRAILFRGFDIQPVSETIYSLPEIPAVINPLQMALIAGSSILVCTFAAFIPAVFAAKLPRPVP